MEEVIPPSLQKLGLRALPCTEDITEEVLKILKVEGVLFPRIRRAIWGFGDLWIEVMDAEATQEGGVVRIPSKGHEGQREVGLSSRPRAPSRLILPHM